MENCSEGALVDWKCALNGAVQGIVALMVELPVVGPARSDSLIGSFGNRLRHSSRASRSCITNSSRGGFPTFAYGELM